MKGVYTPENISFLRDYQVFVFGSNLAGKHDGGSAKIALEKFGAIYGKGVGMQGQSYAIPTLDAYLNPLPLDKVGDYIEGFKSFASNNTKHLFLVTKIGCGIAGFKPEEIAPFFASYPRNVIIPKEFSM